jgi:hypothetical protein
MNSKQGSCGSFCFKYWLGTGCDNCIDDYVKQNNNKKMEQKIERVPANLCATPFNRAIDEKIVEMNKKGFRFIPPMNIIPAEVGFGKLNYNPKYAELLFEK